jgi:2-keto-4-pentenoate hydratase/2-oxohepta-3-ene-1,7-dioic acid hydratase in catechol pathway
MKLVMIEHDGKPISGCLIDDEVVIFNLASSLTPSALEVPGTVAGIVDEDAGGLAAARRFLDDLSNANDNMQSALRSAGAIRSTRDIRLLPPLSHPQNILGHGAAYAKRDFDHLIKSENSVALPPQAFSKSPTAIIGPCDEIRIPSKAPDFVDFEGEVGVVFGRECHNVSRADAMGYVVGFTIVNDVSARDWAINRDVDPLKRAALNIMYKNFPTFCPIGPNITTKDEIENYKNIRLTTALNGKQMQDCTLDELIWDIPDLIEIYSKIFRFMPGDILSTGTPGGVGFGQNPPVYMKHGDVISIKVDGIGELSNNIVGS